MIGTLPTPYPDELFYSLCARFSERMQYTSKRSPIQELFSTGSAIASVGLPSHLDDFVAALPPGHPYTADDLIDNHTLLPFYGPFLPPERLRRVRQDMRGSGGSTLHMRIGIMASRVSSSGWLLACPKCIAEDRERFGECYWHRVHQLPGVKVCPTHKVNLYTTAASANNARTRYEFVSAESAVQSFQRIDLPERYCEIFVRLAQDAQWLLGQRRPPQTLQALHTRYRRLLNDVGLATYRGRVEASLFLNRFKGFYPSPLLNQLSCELAEQISENWLLRLVRTPTGAQHPLHHLLLIHFLGYTLEAFLGLPVESSPFGDGPWPCLNPASNHYRKRRIEECQIVPRKQGRGSPIGILACGCGFTYSRTGPDTSAEDQFKVGKVESFGGVWERRLQELWEDDTVSLRGIACKLGVDPRTVKRHATRLMLTFPRPVGKSLPLSEKQQLHPHPSRAPEAATLAAYRNVWLNAAAEEPNAGVMSIRSRIPGVYTWLYRHDAQWLEEHMPARKETREYQGRVDWAMRDAQLAEAVETSVFHLKSLLGHPVRVTISAVGREMGQLALIQQHSDKLPLTASALQAAVETREDFALRRIQWAVAYCVKGHICPAGWQLIRLAGVERLSEVPEIREAISTALRTLSRITGSNTEA